MKSDKITNKSLRHFTQNHMSNVNLNVALEEKWCLDVNRHGLRNEKLKVEDEEAISGVFFLCIGDYTMTKTLSICIS